MFLRNSWYVAASVNEIGRKPLGRIILENDRNFFDGFTVEGEAQFIKHFGVEEHVEATLSFVPKLIAAVAVLSIAGPWMLTSIVEYLQRTLQSIPTVVG